MSLKKTWIVTIILVLPALFAAAAAIAQQTGQGTAMTVARSHAHSYHHLAPTVAKEQGFFQGITVNILPDELKNDTPNGDALVSDMKARGVQIVPDARIRVLFSHDPAKGRLYALGGWLEGGNETAKLVAGKGVQSLRDLSGKRIGTTAREAENATSLAYWLQSSGVDPEKDVTWVLGLSRNTAGAKALREGRVDAAFVSIEETPIMEREGYHVLWDVAKVYPEGRPERLIVASAELVERNPQAIKSFLKGMIRAYRFHNDWQKNESALKSAVDRLVAVTRDEQGEDYKTSVMIPDGLLPVGALERVLNEEKELGRAPRNLRLESVLNFNLLEEVLADLKRENIWY
jgi:ABC-type nitrate/sulfonate/bicarbonate transport system substrate-binding protein